LIKRHKLRRIELPEAGRKREFVQCFSVPISMVFDFIPNLLVRIHLRSPSWQKGYP
jgi:hypothetical protein